MSYNVLAVACESLGYRDKLRLAQLLIQLARKEEEEENPQKRSESATKKDPVSSGNKNIKIDQDTIAYVKERISKLRPTKVKSLTNSISAMFQFQGGISSNDINKIVAELKKQKFIKLDNAKVTYG